MNVIRSHYITHLDNVTLKNLIKKLLTKIVKWYQNYTTRHKMTALPDHLLKDIGLTRREVRSEASKWFWQ